MQIKHLATSNPDIQAMGSWAWAPRFRHLTTSNPDIQAMGSWAYAPGLGTWRPAILISRLWAAGLRHLGLGTWRPAFAISRGITIEAKYEPLSASTVVVCVCVCCTICKATDAQFAEPQTHILQSNRSVQSTAETSCLPCSVAVALTAIGLTTIGLDACSVALQFNH
jgi:hypothetical protein